VVIPNPPVSVAQKTFRSLDHENLQENGVAILAVQSFWREWADMNCYFAIRHHNICAVTERGKCFEGHGSKRFYSYGMTRGLSGEFTNEAGAVDGLHGYITRGRRQLDSDTDYALSRMGV